MQMLMVWEELCGDPADLEALLLKQVPVQLPQSLDKKNRPSREGRLATA